MTVSRIQADLAARGLYAGRVDGLWGPRIESAWQALLAAHDACGESPRIEPASGGWLWRQAEGALYLDGRRIASGYSGRGEGRNNPALEAVKATGPIPAGAWRIGEPRTSARTGPHVLDLTPDGHGAFGRTAFQIHGDNARGDASSGCIVLNRAVRERISASGLRRLEVRP